MAESQSSVAGTQTGGGAAASSGSWYYARGQERLGPVAEAELRAMAGRGELAPGALVWTEGMAQWQQAREAFQGVFPPGPPAVPATPPTVPTQTPRPPQGDATGGLIPYKNPPALMAYYTAIFSPLPLFPVGLIALGLGIAGLKKRKRQPEVKGAVHAWIGILVGGFFGIGWMLVTGFIAFMAITEP